MDGHVFFKMLKLYREFKKGASNHKVIDGHVFQDVSCTEVSRLQ